MLAALMLVLHVAPATAQSSPVEAARTLRDAGEFQRASRVLEAHLTDHPDDATAARLLGETLYWMQDITGARAVYETALARHPDDAVLRLEYGRMLAETGALGSARTLLMPLADRNEVAARARALLGTLAYWQGDFTTAAKLFSAALEADPAHADARRQLQEIQIATVPWITVSPTWSHDDQPLTRVTPAVSAGWFLTPLTPVTARFDAATYNTGPGRSTAWSGEASLRHFAPGPRLDLEGAVGAVRHPAATGGAAWMARGSIGHRLPRGVMLRARIERAPYFRTSASIDTPVTLTDVVGELAWDDPRGWVGQVAFGQRWYSDENRVRTAYGWVLAPVVRSNRGMLQAGYAVGADHARESRFTSEGRYVPYFTPAHLVVHSVVIALTVPATSRATLRANGNAAVHGREDAPYFYQAASGPLRAFFPRDRRPWQVGGSLDLAAGTSTSVGVSVEVGRTAFYRWTTGGVHVTHRFTGGVLRSPRP